jgi:hypothetical protein
MPSFIPGISHSCSLVCSGIPATTLPPSTASRNRDVSHFAITENHSIEALGLLSR